MSVWSIRLPYDTPPLTANQRLHWRVESTLVRRVRGDMRTLARAHQLPIMARCEVSLAYFPKDRRRRDADNLVPTLKALCDGLVDAGLVPDDTPDLMVKTMPTIGPVQREGALWVTVRRLA